MENQENAFVTERMMEFKKTLFGVKEKDVFEYIDLLTNNLNKARAVYEEKLTEMKNANELLNCERGNQEEKLQELTRMYQALLEDRNNLKQTVDNQHDLAETLRATQQENVRLQGKIENCQIIEAENQRIKIELSENEVNCDMLKQQQSKLFTEIETLKQQNKDMLASHLEEKKQRESAFAEKDLKLTQLLQMYRFTVDQAHATLNTLAAQFDESNEVLSRIHVD